MRPIIGITPSLDEESGVLSLSQNYVWAVAAAGGLPILLPYADKTLAAQTYALCDGLLLSGGDDMDPVYFGEEPHLNLGLVSPLRDAWELALCRLALAHGKPVFGICRGVQVLAVAGGGTLIQDIPTQTQSTIRHRQKPPFSYPSHSVELRPGSRLAEILGTERLRVNSTHHQAVKTAGLGWLVTATASDGVCEGLELPGHPFAIGVQWHPERLREDPAQLALFGALVAAAAGAKGEM